MNVNIDGPAEKRARKLAEEKEKEEKKEKEEIENSLQIFAPDDVSKENCDDQDRDLDNKS